MDETIHVFIHSHSSIHFLYPLLLYWVTGELVPISSGLPGVLPRTFLLQGNSTTNCATVQPFIHNHHSKNATNGYMHSEEYISHMWFVLSLRRTWSFGFWGFYCFFFRKENL
ncbi:hypothetical protein ATANTOWER_009017 [Ataeniobius toweri]|uniref:Uncharacterized protein n=1 Tax=Ataeniobius toweri TaxID=208326 RepID=A0ABU7C7F6_9TELE|nr:hypothetical protein [Ataeniobius toweri]